MKAKDLRNSILQMAVQGKLVPQDPNDEPASVLLERIRAERAKLIKEKKIKAPKGGESVIYRASDGSHYEKRGKGEPVCIDDEIPFEIPESWEWCRFSSANLGSFTGPFGSSLHKSDYVTNGIPVVNPADIVDGRAIAGKMITAETRQRLSSYILGAGDFVIGRRGEMGRAAIISEKEDGWLCGTGCFFAHMSGEVESDYWRLLFSSPYVVNQLESSSVGTTMKNLNLDILGNILIPMPPQREQDAICAQVQQVFQIANQYGTLEDARERLDAELPDRLRKSILQLAVQGKLVAQDPDDEPASALLDRIRAERAKLVKEKKLKAPKGGESVIYRTSDGSYYEKRGGGEPTCIDDEIPFEIPKSWEWARLGSMLIIERGGSPRPIKAFLTDEADGINWIKIGDTEQGDKYITHTREKIRPDGVKKSRFVEEGDFLLTNSMSFGRPYILQTCGCIHDGWLVIREPETIADKDFLFYLLSCPFMFNQFAEAAAGSTVKNLNIDKVKQSLIPLPPREEQNRIAAALDGLLPEITNQ